MTSSAPPLQLWSTMPGWGLAADLTPPEVINSRALKKLRKLLAAGLIALLIVCIGGYVLAARQNSAAASALDQVQVRTAQLDSQSRRYVGVTEIQTGVTQVQTQIAQLMSGDVDLAKLMGSIRSSLPATMAISSEGVTLTAAGTDDPNATTGFNESGLPLIGSVTIAGTGHALNNLATYVDRLQALHGVVNVTPTSNVRGPHGVIFSLSLSLTSALITHRFDVVPAHK